MRIVFLCEKDINIIFKYIILTVCRFSQDIDHACFNHPTTDRTPSVTSPGTSTLVDSIKELHRDLRAAWAANEAIVCIDFTKTMVLFTC